MFLLPLVIIQRLLHRELQLILFSLTRNPNLALGLFSLIFLPGILMHELSHLMMAKLLGVRTGNFSITPRTLSDGRLQLGYVETERSDPFRDSLIGLAPMITGGLVVAYIAIVKLNFSGLWDFLQSWELSPLWQEFLSLSMLPDFPIWFYLALVVSSTMLPSSSDRHSFIPLFLYAGLMVLLALLFGLAPVLQGLLQPLNNFLNAVALVFGFSLAMHLLLLIPALGIHAVLERI
jgi:hypothetical protein